MDTQTSPSTVLESVRLLMTGAVDYAGLFPPSSVSMPEAVLNYATYRNSNFSWMLGRFVCSVARLEELADAARDFVSRDAAHSWRVAAVAGDDLYDTIRRIEDFNANNNPGLICDVVEMKADTLYQIEAVTHDLPRGVTVYFEIDPKVELVEKLTAIAKYGQRAKLRTGGVTPEAFPRSVDVVRFVTACAAANVPFKATAGLHHPIRCHRPLTYAADSPKGTMHGFLNVFLMTGFAIESYRRSFLEDVMEEEFEEVFKVDAAGITWRGEYTLNLHQIERLRTLGIQSFGSCSFDEPVADLQSLGML